MRMGGILGLSSNKNILKTIWGELVYGGHLISLAPTSVSYIYMKVNGYPISWELLLGVYLITYIVHHIDRFIDIKNDSSPDRTEYYSRTKKLQPFVIAMASIVLVFLMLDSLVMTLFALFVVIAGVLYTLIFKNLTRYILGFKSYYTAIVFAAATIFTAFYYKDYEITPVLVLIYVFFFLRWFSNTVFCDLKDVEEDKKYHLKTFASQLGRKQFYTLLNAINMASTIPLILGVILGYLPIYTLVLLLTMVYSLFYFHLSKKPKADYQKLSNVWADGESLVWLVSITVGVLLWA
jgi:4-hydroxybenzoate polyprenyltransferase